MLHTKEWVSKSGNGLVKAVGVFLLIFSIISIIQGIYSLPVSFQEGRFGFNYEPLKDQKALLVTSAVKGYPADLAGLQKGDRILAVNGVPIDPGKGLSTWGDAVAGSKLVLTVQRGNRTIEMPLTRKLMPMLDRAVRVLILLVLPTLLLAYVLVGLWGTFKHPSFITNLIALVCFSFGVIISAAEFTKASSPFTEYFSYYQVRAVIGFICFLLAPASWLFLFVNFPQKANVYKRHKYLVTFIIFFLPVFIAALSRLGENFLKTHPLLNVLLNIGFLSSYILIGIGILSRGAKREKNVLKKRQYQLMLFGIKYGALAIFTGFFCYYAYWLWMINWADFFGWLNLFIFLVTQVVGLIVPFTFLNSFFQNKILETETALRRKLRYLAATSILFFLYLLAAFYLNSWIISKFQVTDPSFIVLIVLVLSLTYSPLHNRMLGWLEEKLYPEKTKYKSSLKELTRKMTGFIEETQLLETLSRWIVDTMGITPIYAVSLDRVRVMGIPLKLDSTKSVLARVKDGSSFFWDEIAEDSLDFIDEDEKRWALQSGISITVPMISRGEPVGILSIGKKRNKEDFTGDDLEIFQEAAYHTAMAIQNIKLQAEHLEKRRIEKELEVARDIQTKLMPRQIPRVEGLQVHGEFRPCFEVGGDYFDILPLDEHRTALVIADVSGKGAGAALLMSNLQACLHMAVSLELPLWEIVYKINNIIFNNSLPSQFITFFLGVWDNCTKELQYINAGHNPPIILGTKARIKRLAPTGIALGLKSDQTYEYQKVPLEMKDVLVIYTDGIEEFFNYQLEAFGVDRMIDTCRENKESHPQDIIYRLFDRLKDFAGGKEAYHCDDLTIIIAKRTD